MSARVLVVDTPELTGLEARLTAEYLDVLTAPSGAEALAACARGTCDLVVVAAPGTGAGRRDGNDGIELCRRLKLDPQTRHIPVLAIVAADGAGGRIHALQAGADDVAARPLDEALLIARVRSLLRLKLSLDELRGRARASACLGIAGDVRPAVRDGADRVLLIEDRASAAMAMRAALEGQGTVELESDPKEALSKSTERDYDLFVVSLGLQGYDGLRLCSQLRSPERARRVPVLVVAEPEDRLRILRGLELGIDGYVLRPVGRDELAARARTQLRRKHDADGLRAKVEATIAMAVLDTLTGLSNRRFFDANVPGMVERAARSGRPLSLMMLDIDHFKKVNDAHGHDAGDRILKSFAERVRRVVRASDLFCRLGGEEFAIVMPETDITVASRIAERVRGTVERSPFVHTLDQPPIVVTSSIGLAERGPSGTVDTLMRAADLALYESKGAGRNRVTLRAAEGAGSTSAARSIQPTQA